MAQIQKEGHEAKAREKLIEKLRIRQPTVLPSSARKEIDMVIGEGKGLDLEWKFLEMTDVLENLHIGVLKAALKVDSSSFYFYHNSFKQ